MATDLQSDPELMELTRRQPSTIQAAMLQTLRAGRWSGYIRSDLDLPTLADRVCQSMLHVGLDVIRHKAATDELATLKSRITLEGLAVDIPSDTDLDKSNAFAAAEAVIRSWVDTEDDTDLKAAHVRAVARSEFGRRGYEMTTIRDIASAAFADDCRPHSSQPRDFGNHGVHRTRTGVSPGTGDATTAAFCPGGPRCSW